MDKQKIVLWNIDESKKLIRKEIRIDNLIMFFTRVVEDLRNHQDPNFYGRIKDIYSSIFPYEDIENPKEILVGAKKSSFESTEGLNLDKKEGDYLKEFVKNLNDKGKLENKAKIGYFEKILEELISRYLPESQKIVEPYILGKLICSVGGIGSLYKKPSSTIQLIGAEKAMFRHMSRNKPCPKYGLLYYSKKVQESNNKGKEARQLANKLAISIRVDYFKNFAR